MNEPEKGEAKKAKPKNRRGLFFTFSLDFFSSSSSSFIDCEQLSLLRSSPRQPLQQGFKEEIIRHGMMGQYGRRRCVKNELKMKITTEALKSAAIKLFAIAGE
jgi:hypothetical protein